MKFDRVDMLVNDVPLLLIDDGEIHEDRMKKARVTVDDILEAARRLRGIERLEQIKFAVLERSGGVTVIPRPGELDHD